MRGKRAKQYRKLMHQYELAFNFRVPYQVLVDAEMIKDTTRFRMDLPHLLERTLHGEIKPMITQCSIRHLYTSTHEDRAEKSQWIETAKKFERRRCGHHELEQPLSTHECLMSVVDGKESGNNKHRYIVASQDAGLRAQLRKIAGVPLVYVSRSVMVMEPMAAKTEEVRNGQEAEKIRAGVRRGRPGQDSAPKRKRENEESGDEETEGGSDVPAAAAQPATKKPRNQGPKAPNPLSVRKAKKREEPRADGHTPKQKMPDRITKQIRAAKEAKTASNDTKPDDDGTKRKRKRTKPSTAEGETAAPVAADGE